MSAHIVELVQSGMELVSWDCAPNVWLAHCEDARWRRLRWETRVGLALMPTMPAALAASVFLAVGGWPMPFVFAVSQLAVPLILAVALRWMRFPGSSATFPPAPRVLFTSTGLRVGEMARLWRGRRCRVVDARVRWRILEIRFRTKLLGLPIRTETFELPFPPRIESDIEELAEMLRNRDAPASRLVAVDESSGPIRATELQ